MADPRRSRGTPKDGGTDGPNRWVVVIGIAVAAAVLGLMIYLHLSGTIGPGIH
jgi:hypothetical protein